MRSTIVVTLALLASAHAAPAQTVDAVMRPRPEIGIRGGFLSITQKSDFGSESYTAVALPSAAPFMPGGIHFTFFTSPRFALEPQLSILRLSDGGNAFTLTHAALQANYFLAADATRAPYLFGQVGTIVEDEGDGSDNQSGFGGGIGYRRVYRESIALRYEARYRRWSSEFAKTNEFGLLVGVAAVIR